MLRRSLSMSVCMPRDVEFSNCLNRVISRVPFPPCDSQVSDFRHDYMALSFLAAVRQLAGATSFATLSRFEAHEIYRWHVECRGEYVGAWRTACLDVSD